MLKVIYTQTGQHLEALTESRQTWIALQHTLARQAGQTLQVQKCTATLLLSTSPTLLDTLIHIAAGESNQTITWAIADCDYTEVVLSGTWLYQISDPEEGAFVADVSNHTATSLIRLWLMHSQTVSCI